MKVGLTFVLYFASMNTLSNLWPWIRQTLKQKSEMKSMK